MHSTLRSFLSRSPARAPLASSLRHLGLLAALCLLACSSTTGDGRCADGRLACADECVDETKSLLHCGGCGVFCQAGEDCVAGVCACVPGLTACSGACTDLRDDPANCGACGRACELGQVCSAGECTGACGPDLTACGASCAQVTDSVFFCGSCEGSCQAGQVCEGGACQCTQGRANCGDGCTDLDEDPLNCGQCGVVCAVGSTCSVGVCEEVGLGSGGTGGQGTGGASGVGGHSSGSGGLPGSGGGAPGAGGASGGAASGGAPGSGGAGGCGKAGFYVENGFVFDANCNEFTMRGVNYPYAWYSSRDTQADFNDIAATGANVVRIVLSAGRWQPTTTAANVTSLIEWAKNAKLIAMLEVHDTTGYNDTGAEGSVALSAATAFWTDPAMVGALTGQEAYVLINIGNEPNGNDSTASWAPSHVTAVGALRQAGLAHTIVVDAPNWGQDWEESMKNGGGSVIWDADPDKNLIFSVHMYQVYEMGSTVTSYINTFLSNYEAPLIVGEFAADHGEQGGVDEATIMSTAEMLGIGYLGWSWSGNSTDLVSLDMTLDFTPSNLTAWGNTIINGEDGLKATGEVCSIFQ